MNKHFNDLILDQPCSLDDLLADLSGAVRPAERNVAQALLASDLSQESAIRAQLHRRLLTQAAALGPPRPAASGLLQRMAPLAGGVAVAWLVLLLVMLAPTRWYGPGAPAAMSAAVPTAPATLATGLPTVTSLPAATPSQSPIATGQMVAPMPTLLISP
jgi:hypothetical protein